MKKEIILSGFGGQGVMSIGKNLVEVTPVYIYTSSPMAI